MVLRAHLKMALTIPILSGIWTALVSEFVKLRLNKKWGIGKDAFLDLIKEQISNILGLTTEILQG